MAPHHMLKFIFAMVLAIAAVVAINTLAAVPQRSGISTAATDPVISRPEFLKVY